MSFPQPTCSRCNVWIMCRQSSCFEFNTLNTIADPKQAYFCFGFTSIVMFTAQLNVSLHWWHGLTAHMVSLVARSHYSHCLTLDKARFCQLKLRYFCHEILLAHSRYFACILQGHLIICYLFAPMWVQNACHGLETARKWVTCWQNERRWVPF